jgi:DNA-binding MarR family transcriptional regulator
LLPVADPLPFDPIAEARRNWATHWGDEPLPWMGAVTSIMRVEQIIMGRLNAMLKPWKLTFPRYEALMLLYFSRSGSLPLGKMGVRLQVHRTSVTNTIDGLERLGLVERTRHESDRRTTLASITDRGRIVAEEATAVLNRERFGIATLEPDDLGELYDILHRLRVEADDFDETETTASQPRG